MSDLVLRPYVAADFDAFVAAQTLAFARLALGAYSRAELERVARARHAPGRREEMLCIDEWVAETRAGQIVAAAGQSPQPGETGTARIRRVFVHPDWAGRGLGRRLVGEAEQRARAAGHERFVVCASLNAVPFYERLGFVALRPEPREYEGSVVQFTGMRKA
jgi:putative acetyltransferase